MTTTKNTDTSKLIDRHACATCSPEKEIVNKKHIFFYTAPHNAVKIFIGNFLQRNKKEKDKHDFFER